MVTSSRAENLHSLAWRGLALMLLIVQVAWQPLQAAAAAANPGPGASVPGQLPPASPRFDAPLATTSLNLPATVLLGQEVDFTVTFQNTAATGTGYGPFIDLIIPSSQGLGTSSITASYQGVSLALGTNLFINTFNASDQVTHPLVRTISGSYLVVDGAAAGAVAGDKLVTIKLPFGSYTPGQPAISIDVAVNMAVPPAQVNVPLPLSARGGYQFGATPLDDWCCDSVVNTLSGWSSASVTPELLTLAKSYSGPENEAVSGPNFSTFYPMEYTVAADIAPGQTLSNLTLSDDLPDNLWAVGWVNTTGSTSCTILPLAAPGGTLGCDYTSASGHVAFTFSFYIPLTDGVGSAVIDATSGTAVTSCNNAAVSATWETTPINVSTSSSPSGCGDILNDRSLAVQKSAAVVGGGTLEPGVLIKNVLDFQVSDYFAFDHVQLLDIVSDGQHFVNDPGYLPTLQVNGHGYSLPAAAFAGGNYTVDCYYGLSGGSECGTSHASNSANPDQYGTTQLNFAISQQIISASTGAEDGKLIGGCVSPTGSLPAGTPADCSAQNAGAVSGEIVFYTRVLNNFVDNDPSGDPSVDQGDQLTNVGKYIQGDVLDTGTLAPTGGQPQDASGASLTVPTGTLTKSIYAINGDTSLTAPVHINPGDAVTYELKYALPVSNEENLRFSDYLPLPIFNVADPTADGSHASWSFSTTPSVMTPATVSLGPADTFYQYMLDGTTGPLPHSGSASPSTNPVYGGGNPLSHDGSITPWVVVDATKNSVSITYPNYDDTRLQSTVVDLLVTATVTDQPFADQLYLTNEAYSFEGSTNAGIVSSTKIQQVVINEPVLVSKKGVIWTSNPNNQFSPDLAGPVTFLSPYPTTAPRWSGTISAGYLAAHPIDSNVSHVDAGDIVTFAITIQNTGSSDKGAFDIDIQDSLPPQFQVPADSRGLDLQIYYGDGLTSIAYTRPDGSAATASDLFAGGIRLVDPVGEGVCQAHSPATTNDVIVLTYDLQLVNTVNPGDVINTAQVTHYASQEGGPNLLSPSQPLQDTSTTTINVGLAKTLVGTSIDQTYSTKNLANQAVIGEIVTYKIVTTFPEGVTPAAQIVDTLDSGLAFYKCDSVTRSSAALTTTQGAGDFSDLCSGGSPAVSTYPSGSIKPVDSGRQITWDLGTVSNSDTDNSTAETLTFVYEAVVLNVTGNTAGHTLSNSAALTYTEIGGTTGKLTASAAAVTVISPWLQLTKSVNPTTAQAGDTVAYALTLQHAATSGADAFDVALSDPLPTCPGGESMLQNPSIASVVDSGGSVVKADFNLTGSNGSGWTLNTGTTFDMPYSATRTITVNLTGTLCYSVYPMENLTNTGAVTWTSLPGNISTPISTYNTTSVERTGVSGVGSGLNNYAANGSIPFTATNVTPAKIIQATSDLDTSAANVAIGEIVRYRIVISVPQGESPDFQVHDVLPAGLQYLNDSTSKLAFLSSGLGGVCAGGASMTSSTLADTLPSTNLWMCGNETNLGTTTPSFLIPAAAIATSGNEVDFNLGTLSNQDNDSDQEYVIIEFNTLVLNVTGNQAGTNIDNQYQVFVNGSRINTSTTATVHVVEAAITFTKSIVSLPAQLDSGGKITYRLAIANATGADVAPAYDLVLNDTLAPELTLDTLPASLAITTSGTVGAIDTSSSAVHTPPVTASYVEVHIASLAPGASVQVDYTATINDSITAAEVISNTGNLTWTSLPGPQGSSPNATGSTTPGASGATNGERSGPTGPGDTLNDYTAQASSATFTAASPSITKQLLATSLAQTTGSNVTIGEVLNYGIFFTVPEGTTPADQVVDTLPAGLQLVPGSAQILTGAAASGGLLSADFNGTIGTSAITETTGPGGGVTFAFQNIVAAGDNVTTNNTLLLRYQALVLDVTGNVGFPAATTLTNSATNQLGSGPLSTPVTVTATLVEAKPTLAKTVSDTHPAPGENVTYTLAIDNSLAPSGSDAFDVVLSDTIDTSLTLNLASIHVASTAPLSQPSWTPAPANTSTAAQVLLTFPSIPLGATVTVTYQATVNTGAAQNTVILNTGNLTWTSLPGTAAGERTGTVGSTTAPDNYFASSSATATIQRDFTKALVAESIVAAGSTETAVAPALPDVTIGEMLTYRMVLTLPPGATTAAVLTDVLDRGLAYVDCSLTAESAISSSAPGGLAALCQPGAPVVSTYPSGSTNPADAGRQIVFDFGNLTNSDTAAHTLTITYHAVVLDSQENRSGVTDLKNNAQLTWSTGTLAASTPGVDVKEANLTVVKTVDSNVAPLGDFVHYVIDVSHSSLSLADAYDVRLTDVIPPSLAIDQNSVKSSGIGIGLSSPTVTVSGSTLTVYWAHFPLTATAEITFTAQFIGPSPAVNQATLEWSSIQIDPRPEFTPQSTFNSLSTERRYVPTSAAINNYQATSAVTLRVPILPKTGFAPGVRTDLPVQPLSKAYDPLNGLWLEIPALGLKMPILGVPGSGTTWDLTWLTSQAGYLEGTAYPTTVGTTGLTGHVTLADGSPGPFAHLGDLRWGDPVILHANGLEYIYEVRTNQVVAPTDLSVLRNDGYTWVTLLTCKGYSAAADDYSSRVAVRAVLIQVAADTAAGPSPASQSR